MLLISTLLSESLALNNLPNMYLVKLQCTQMRLATLGFYTLCVTIIVLCFTRSRFLPAKGRWMYVLYILSVFFGSCGTTACTRQRVVKLSYFCEA